MDLTSNSSSKALGNIQPFPPECGKEEVRIRDFGHVYVTLQPAEQ